MPCPPLPCTHGCVPLPSPCPPRSSLDSVPSLGSLCSLPLVASSPERSGPGSTCGQTAPTSAGGTSTGRERREGEGCGAGHRTGLTRRYPSKDQAQPPSPRPTAHLLLRPTSCLHSPPTPSSPLTPSTQPAREHEWGDCAPKGTDVTSPRGKGRSTPRGLQDAALSTAHCLSRATPTLLLKHPAPRHTSQVTSQTLQQEGRRFSSGNGSVDPNARGSPARPARPAPRTCGSPAASASAPGSCRSAPGAASALRSRRRASARCSAALGQCGAPSARRPRCTRHESEDTAWDGRRPPAPRSRRTHWALRAAPALPAQTRLRLPL